MPARTGNTTYVPGVGATTVKGTKKTFQGSGLAPAGATKEPEATYLTAPTVTVSGGTVKASGYRSQRAAKRAVRAQKRRAKRVARIVNETKPEPQTLPKAPPKYTPPKLTPIQKATQKSAKAFNAEGGKQVPLPFTEPTGGRQNVPTGGRQKVAKRIKTEFRQAKKAVASLGGHLTGDLGPEQRKFIRGVAKLTHLKPRTIAAQARAEESFGYQTEADQTHNFLNMGPGISYPSLKAGVKATAANYNDTSSPNYAGVRATRGQSARRQAEAIAASPWGTGDLILQTLPEVGFKGKPNPKAERKLARVKAEAKEKGVQLGVGKAPAKVVTRYKAGLSAAKELAHSHIPYPTPDQHFGLQDRPAFLDCSAAVSWVLNKMGVLKTELVSGEMGSVLKPGPGAVTVFYNAGHTFMSFGGKFFGTSVNDSSKGLAFYKNPGSAYLSQYSVGHVAGLGKKQAIQLGLGSPTSGTQSFPGMTLSSSGTSATIDSGAGTTQSKPGFSKQPIRLTQQQKVNQTKRALKDLGVGVSTTATPQTSDSMLSELEKKYGLVA